MRRNRTRGEAVGNDERQVMLVPRTGREPRLLACRQSPAQIRAHQILLSVPRRACHHERRQSERFKIGAQSFVGASAPIVTGTTFIFVREPY